jgi:head-tail adaptor
MSLRAGEFDRYVGLYHVVLTTNALGEQVQSWPSAYANVWAKKKDAVSTRRGTKESIADQFSLLQYTEYTIRYMPDLLATDRLIEGSLSFEIVQIAEFGRREAWILLCKAVQP